MSVRNYNSSRTYGRFSKQDLTNRRKKNIDYTQIYKEALPSHDVEAMRQFAEKREKQQRMLNIMKRKRERDEINHQKQNEKKKKIYNNNNNEIISKINNTKKRKKNNVEYNIDKIRKKNKRKIIDSLF